MHHFLYLHVYQEALLTYKVSKVQANFITFLFSSILHELVLTIMCGGSKIKIYFFFLQMLQIPLIYIGRLSFFSKHPTFAVPFKNLNNAKLYFYYRIWDFGLL